MNDKLELLAQMPLFRSLSQADLQYLYNNLGTCQFEAGEILFREGEPGDSFYLLQEGQIEIIKALGTQEELVIARRSPGEFVGEMSLLEPHGLRTASVRALTRTRLWFMTRQEFNALLHRQPMLAYEMIHVLADRLNAAHNLSISELQEKNLQLTRAYEELKAAQAQIIEKERLERELQVAYDIQMSVLPPYLPSLLGYDFGARLIPARSVGGDFYDFVPLGHDRVAISIGDVTDKGVPAAIFMAQVHALLRAETSKSASPSKVLTNANRHLLEMNARGLFATVLFGILDTRNGEFVYARAGHDLPLVVSGPDQVALAPKGFGQPLGILAKPQFDVQVLKLPPAGFLLLYTDGVTDGRNPAGQVFGLERLKPFLGRMSSLPAQPACDEIMAMLMDYQGGAAQEDDITLVAIRSSLPSG
ncbi:MAG TPA: SpoIIE family protein phosphatase [Anaerolineales bacterium]|nr:SpoIIE family protein phosphatase [Anaerolineales bacterium]